MSEALEVHGTPEEAGVYRFIEEVFRVDDLIDPEIVRAIRIFDPSFVPLLVRRIYRSPNGGRVMRQYHVIGRYIPNPTDDYAKAAIELEYVPRGFKFDRRKIHALRTLWAPWPGPNDEGGPSKEWELCMPPAEVKPGPWLVEQLQAVHKFFDVGIELTYEDGVLAQTGVVGSTVDRINQILEAEKKRDEQLQSEAITEARYRMKQNWPAMKKAAEEGRWQDKPKDRKPFVDYGNTQ